MAEMDEIKELKEQLAQQAKLINVLLAQVQPGNTAPSGTRSDDVTIVHMYARAEGLPTHIELTNLSIDLTTFGEERILSRQQFEELVGRYRKVFTDGYIALADQHKELAKRYNVKTESEYKMTRKIAENLAALDIATLTDLFKKSPIAHQQLIAETWKRKIIEKDEAYMDLNKVSILNSLTEGAFQYDLNELMNVYNKTKKKK
jgi:hypothetical protein